MSWIDIDQDITFNQFGDIKITDNDIETLDDAIDILKQNIIDRIKSSYGDYDLYPTYGSNIHSIIGMSNNAEAEARVQAGIINCLTSDRFLNPRNIKLFAKKINSNMFIKLEIATLLSNGEYKPLSLALIFGLNKEFVYAT